MVLFYICHFYICILFQDTETEVNGRIVLLEFIWFYFSYNARHDGTGLDFVYHLADIRIQVNRIGAMMAFHLCTASKAPHLCRSALAV